ncbi:MAG: hypothetical protein AB7F86_11910 [Bdellovibrionales bacterium]
MRFFSALLISFAFVTAWSALAIDTVSTGYRLNSAGNVRIDTWGKCRDVTNTSGRDHFIATRTQPEWWSFISLTPPGLGKAICPILAEYTLSPQKTAPSASAMVGVAGSGTAWGNSGWVQVIASTSAAIVITGVVVDAQVSAEFEIDVGRGTAGSEVVVGTLSGTRKSAAGGPWWLQFPIAIDNIGAGQRVAIRFRRGTTTTTAWNFRLTYYEKPLLGGTIATTSQASKVMPSASAGTSVTPSGTAWVSGAWAQVTASTANAIVLGGISVQPPAAAEYEIDVGTGAAGFETVVATFRDITGNANGGPYYKVLKPPLDNIASGTRVALRIRASTTTTTAHPVKLIYYDSPVGLTLHNRPLKWAPAAAVGATITPVATAWADSAWTELISVAPTDLQLAGFIVFIGAAANYELEFGVGQAGFEYPIAFFKGAPSNANLVDFTPYFVPMVNSIPTGSRLAVRLRKASTSTTAWRVAVAYYEDSTSANKASAYHRGLPDGATALNLTPSGTAWANSSYLQFSAGLTDDILLTSVGYDPPANAEFELDIATGAAGFETVQTTLSGIVQNGGGQQMLALSHPLYIPAGSRIALRMRKEGTSTAVWPVVMNYVHFQ